MSKEQRKNYISTTKKTVEYNFGNKPKNFFNKRKSQN